MTATTQYMEALAFANQVRLANAKLTRDVKAMPARDGAEFVADVVENDAGHETRGAIPVDRLLLSVRRLGQTKTTKLLQTAGVVYHGKRLRNLTPRQRKVIAVQLRLWAVGYGR